MKQKEFFRAKSEFSKARIAHGGVTAGQRKVFRPLDRRRKLHLILKSSHARGAKSFVAHKLDVRRIVEAKAEKYAVTIHGFEIMRDHIHLFISFKARELVQTFMKTVTGLIARFITKAQRGKPFGKRFWDGLAFTRIVKGRRDERGVTNYLAKNRIEREDGPLMRRALEFHEAIEREARRRKITYDRVLREWLDHDDSVLG